MKFSAKITLSTVTLLCVTLSAGGALNIRQNFAEARLTALAGYAASHQRVCFSLETALGGTDASAADILAASKLVVRGSVGEQPQTIRAEPYIYRRLPP